VGDALVEGAGGAGSRYAGDGRIWRAKPNIEPRGLDMGGTCEFPPQEGGGALKVAEEGRFNEVGGLEPGIREGSGFSARDRESSPLDLISMGHAGNRWIAEVGGCQLREKGYLNGWGAWNPGYTRGARFGAQNRKSSATRSIPVGPAGSASRRYWRHV